MRRGIGRGIAWVATCIGIATFALGGCKPKVGAKCNSGQEICVDKSNGLFCGSDNKFAAMSCGGPKGCEQGSQGFSCDNSLASAGDGCETNDDVSCSTDKKAALECHNNKFEVGSTCKGPKGCTLDDDKISCDNNTADVDDPCHFDDDYACASDKQTVLKCTANKMVAYNACRGPNGCVIKEEPLEHKIEFDCDDTFANAGDNCDTEGNPACSTDKKSLLKCTGGKFVAHKTCGSGCDYDTKRERFFCDGQAGTHTAHSTSKASGAAGGTAATAGSAGAHLAATAAIASAHPATSATAPVASAHPAASTSAHPATTTSAHPATTSSAHH